MSPVHTVRCDFSTVDGGGRRIVLHTLCKKILHVRSRQLPHGNLRIVDKMLKHNLLLLVHLTYPTTGAACGIRSRIVHVMRGTQISISWGRECFRNTLRSRVTVSTRGAASLRNPTRTCVPADCSSSKCPSSTLYPSGPCDSALVPDLSPSLMCLFYET